MYKDDTFNPTAPGAKWLRSTGMPAAVITYLASDPDETAESIMADLDDVTIEQVKVALWSLHARGFIRKILHRPGHYAVTDAGFMAIVQMNEMAKAGRRAFV